MDAVLVVARTMLLPLKNKRYVYAMEDGQAEDGRLPQKRNLRQMLLARSLLRG
jgi:hypothetical protein